MLWRILILVSALLALPAAAEPELEVIPLRHQTLERVLPALQPLLEPGASLSGMNNQLFLRASARNRAEIRQALAAIDTPPRRLVVRVSQNRGSEAESRGGNLSGQVVVGTSKRLDAGAQIWDTRSVRDESASQMVQTVEGGQAYIQVGRSLPIPLHQMVIGPGGAVVSETVVYRDIGRGFYAEPRLNGDRITLEISQQNDSPGTYGAVDARRQRLSTTVSGRLGEWIELGGSGRRENSSGTGGWSRSTADVRHSGSVWLRVDELQ